MEVLFDNTGNSEEKSLCVVRSKALTPLVIPNSPGLKIPNVPTTSPRHLGW